MQFCQFVMLRLYIIVFLPRKRLRLRLWVSIESRISENTAEPQRAVDAVVSQRFDWLTDEQASERTMSERERKGQRKKTQKQLNYTIVHTEYVVACMRLIIRLIFQFHEHIHTHTIPITTAFMNRPLGIPFSDAMIEICKIEFQSFFFSSA